MNKNSRSKCCSSKLLQNADILHLGIITLSSSSRSKKN
jgi:hypothetical protein